ncbi:hypothetical protein JG687_00014469 [Phytophthora cactorum]|uniref:Uncharacterized protein n=1 Tax=Phytophthora cactorum TaxID=29920 RepID=A0A8T1TXN2_9STRA|nr:hypothetical protein JG687_00014469 [Phytophthora cactorum]
MVFAVNFSTRPLDHFLLPPAQSGGRLSVTHDSATWGTGDTVPTEHILFSGDLRLALSRIHEAVIECVRHGPCGLTGGSIGSRSSGSRARHDRFLHVCLPPEAGLVPCTLSIGPGTTPTVQHCRTRNCPALDTASSKGVRTIPDNYSSAVDGSSVVTHRLLNDYYSGRCILLPWLTYPRIRRFIRARLL